MKNKNFNFSYFAKNISIVFAIVLMWRGIWYILDRVDLLLFGGGHMLTAATRESVWLSARISAHGHLCPARTQRQYADALSRP